MSIYKSINMNTNIIEKGILTAPKITITELKKIVVDYYLDNKSLIELENVDAYIEDEFDDETDLEAARLYAQSIIEFSKSKVHNDIGLRTIYNDFYSGTGEYKEFPCEGFHTLDNGFTFFGFVGAGDETGSYFFIMYYDGNDLRGYIPKYGNTYLADIKVFESLYDYMEDCKGLYDDWYKSPHVQTLTTDERLAINKYLKEDCYLFDNQYEEYGELEGEDALPLTGTITKEIFETLPKGTAYRIANSYKADAAEDYDWEAVITDIKSAIIVK